MYTYHLDTAQPQAAALGSKQRVRIVAVDERFTAAVDLTARAQAPALRDRRLEDALDPSVPMLQRRRIVLAQAG